ncbi:MAG: nuclear transport factor 2 family protein [Gammaproteobacteria bacterium]|nr:nuclear transport factor 2 family protein [Gammaproteobacteria bacterium]
MNRTTTLALSAILLAATAVVAAVHAATRGSGERPDDVERSTAEIARLPVAYAWAVDGKNIDDMMDIFAENAVYDLSAYGHASVAGRAAIRELFLRSVFRAEQCSFSSISNVRVEVHGARASGADYFVHLGYRDPSYPENTRHYVEGQHFYEFVREGGRWKISRMLGRPTFETTETFAPEGLRHCP